MSDASVRILGLDPGLRRTGWGLIDVDGPRITHVAHGVIAPLETSTFADRLVSLFNGVATIISQFCPQEAAIEEAFLNTNPASTLKLGHARGAVMLSAAKAQLVVGEYAAKEVKKSIVGTGGAKKAQVEFMVRHLLPTSGSMTSDSADALAVAITHAHVRSSIGRQSM